jgi:hypothetical protein
VEGSCEHDIEPSGSIKFWIYIYIYISNNMTVSIYFLHKKIHKEMWLFSDGITKLKLSMCSGDRRKTSIKYYRCESCKRHGL